MTVDMKELRRHLDEVFREVKELVAQQDKEIKELGAAREETGKKLDAATKRLDEIEAEYKALVARVDGFEAQGQRPSYGSGEVKGLGERFVESDAYKRYVEGGLTGLSAPFPVKSFFTKATLTGGSLGNVPGYVYAPERVAEIFARPDRMQRIRDLLPVNRTSQGAIEFVRETGFTNAATPVAEGAPKPESGLAFEIVSTSVKTIAHYLPATRQIIADAAQLQSYIENRLIVGLKLVEDAQILYGDGTGANLSGIMTNPDIQTYNWSQGQAGDTKVDAIRRAMTKARIAEYPVSGVVLHPNDWEDIELLKGSDQHYIWVRVEDGGVPRLWRVPVVETTAINEGEFLTGAFSLGAAIWDREEAAIRISDSHADFFIRNLYAILAEERIALTVYRPEAFVRGVFDNPPPSA
mgnify:CR=1 FL=1